MLRLRQKKFRMNLFLAAYVTFLELYFFSCLCNFSWNLGAQLAICLMSGNVSVISAEHIM
jgi:hypothetical protein